MCSGIVHHICEYIRLFRMHFLRIRFREWIIIAVHCMDGAEIASLCDTTYNLLGLPRNRFKISICYSLIRTGK